MVSSMMLSHDLAFLKVLRTFASLSYPCHTIGLPCGGLHGYGGSPILVEFLVRMFSEARASVLELMLVLKGQWSFSKVKVF